MLPSQAASATPPEIQFYASGEGRTIRRELADGVRSSIYVKDVGDKYFVTITQRKGTSGAIGGGNIVEVKKSTGPLGVEAVSSVGASDFFDVKPVFGATSEELLVASRYLSERSFKHTSKSILFAIGLLDYTKANLDQLAIDLESIICKAEQEQ